MKLCGQFVIFLGEKIISVKNDFDVFEKFKKILFLLAVFWHYINKKFNQKLFK